MGTAVAVFFGVLGANFLFIALKAFQQLNVVHNQYLLVVPTSLCMAVGEAYVVASIATQGFNWYIVLAMGLGGGTGAIASMHLHSYLQPRLKCVYLRLKAVWYFRIQPKFQRKLF